MRFSLGIAALATAVVTAAAQVVAAQIRSDNSWVTNPFIAFFGALIITVYAYTSLTRQPHEVKRPELVVGGLGAVVLLASLIPTWLGSQEAGFKLQMTAQMVALVVCLVGLLPPIVRAKASSHQSGG